MSLKSGKRSNLWVMVSIGMMAGLIIGFAAALFVQSHVGRGISDPEDLVTDTVSTAEETTSARKKTQESGSTTVNDEELYADDLLADSVPAVTDSLYHQVDRGDDTLQITLAEGSDMVRRDVMVGIKRIRPDLEQPDESSAQRTGGGTDTLLSALTSIKIPEGIHREYVVEFWQNPLNYRGYRLTRDKIVLFGMDIDQIYRLEVRNGVLVLVGGNREYVLKEGSGFSPLVPVRRK